MSDTFKVNFNFSFTLFGTEYILCEDIDVDRDIDLLITGACLQVTDTSFIISREILEQEMDPNTIEEGIKKLIQKKRRGKFRIVE